MNDRPLSPWAYFGLEILYSIPIIGFIFLLIHAIGGGNINRRNFARSYFCVLIIVLIAGVIFFLVGGLGYIQAFIQNFGSSMGAGH